ncbi:hypothetical protein TSTA_023260 [Talaromyces stipitatus ATCC 10500]|uniref:Uncharacterized protein n=1 Tax=Talaromyces stipitatus (strain ATCC 10500 / CBS 375.48 / QM 6759 / NRRL 1006) TaxID=441959 RepID=B8MEY9_TALSN|nr:uncharacterized protein TSTA_023260 [Talaromyces stipitatus ATCC 10500]EED17272.1 hypothetical protein TSTA_023260 [Talaromyces stipitatus ATCC 10500]
MVDTFMIRGSQSLMQWMLDLRIYGLKIHYNTTTEGHVGWQNHDELLYKDLQFTMSEFRGMVDRTTREAWRILMEDLLQCSPEDAPAIPWDWLYDNPHIQRHPALRRKFMHADEQTFLEKLIACTQFTWGQPARAPELLSICHENSQAGGIRNVFIEDGLVVLVTKYHKGYQMSGDIKIIQ